MEQLVQWGILPGYFLQIPEQLKILKTHPRPSSGETEKVIVAGATDLYVQQPEELLDKNLEFISQRKGLTGIRRENNTVYIGAGTTMEEMKHSPLINELFPNMKGYLNLVSSTIMRNRATLAGNIVNASPIGDLTIILLALEARLCLVKGTAKRELPLKKFFKGYKQLDMKKGEIIEAITFPVPGEGSRFHFEKVSQRKCLDIASCNTAISIKTEGNIIKDIHLSAGGVAPIPLYLEKTCAYLKGKEITDKTLHEVVKVMEQEISPISDVRGSAEYKTLLLRNLIFAHFLTIFPDKNLAMDEHGEKKKK
jgi:xanthine dehydrogenase small subunit